MKEISYLIITGDSLSDRGTANKDVVCGFIPLALSHDLKNTSPRGRFTNGYVWADIISSMFASDFLVKQLKKKFAYRNDDISDSLIAKESMVTDALHKSYKLDDDLYVKFAGRDFIRCYDEAGLSSYNYAWSFSINFVRFVERIVLPTLAEKRMQLLAYDQQHKVSQTQKEKTLVIEWSGANDLITVNDKPSILAVDRAISERIKNAEILIKNGYQNFILFNIPNLALTPRFQTMLGPSGESERKNAEHCSLYFNEQLKIACDKLRAAYPQCTLDIFDINETFTDAYTNPAAYDLDAEKLKQAYKASVDFKMLPNGTSPAKGYMFWDDIHPSAKIHVILADKFYQRYASQYHFSEPKSERSHVTQSRQGFFKSPTLRRSASLDAISEERNSRSFNKV